MDRVEQFYVESYEIISKVSDLIAAGKFENIGGMIDLSQQNAERFLKNQTDETICLQRSARELGAIAASAFGAGFGGSAYAIVPTRDAEDFKNEWCSQYGSRFPQHSPTGDFFTTRPSQIVLG